MKNCLQALITCVLILFSVLLLPAHAAEAPPDFNREIRPILSNHCIACHGPDEQQRKAKLRLDSQSGAQADLGGHAAIVPGRPEASELLSRLVTSDEEERMPPKSKGAALKPEEIERIRRWIANGARYDVHWSYAAPKKTAPPAVDAPAWPLNEIDRFLLARMERDGWKPAPEADRRTLARRLALDLTGLPPTWEEVDRFVRDPAPDAYDRLVNNFLKKPEFGEHWATGWLDLARYADSSGYPSDQPREIWRYRDWVIEAFNRNLPFDQFTIDQIAGDLLPNPEEDQIIATAFHRNTMTQNEGGTSDEEFRIAAVVDRVNTTMAVWMGTTMACAQCHSHKYDPITQRDYYRFFAILNQSADADRKDETPVHPFYTAEQKLRRSEIDHELKQIEQKFANPAAAVVAGTGAWEQGLPVHASWEHPLIMVAATGSKAVWEEGTQKAFVPAPETAAPASTITVEVALNHPVLGVRIEALADDRLPGHGPGHAGGNFVITHVQAEVVPAAAAPLAAKRIRIERLGDAADALALAEVQVFRGGANLAPSGHSRQDSDGSETQVSKLAIDGKTDGNAATGKSVAVTGAGKGAHWWELEWNQASPVDRIVVWRRTDSGPGTKITELQVSLFDESGQTVWVKEWKKSFGVKEELTITGVESVAFAHAYADVSQSGFQPIDVLAEEPSSERGWGVAGFTGQNHELTLVPVAPINPRGAGTKLVLRIDQRSKWAGHTLGSFRVALTEQGGLAGLAGLPGDVREVLAIGPAARSAAQQQRIQDYYVREVAPELQADRSRLAALRKEQSAIKPFTVPVMAELADKERRTTKVQIRGNWQNLGDEVSPGVPEAFPPLPPGLPANRLSMARWMVDRNNPLTARVVVNRYWEAIFGVGIVRTSEEFGSQGEPPFHPELLDWLAVDFMEHGWDVKRLLKQLVNCRAYRQDSRASQALIVADPDNRLLARGPRFRPGGEVLRDQALAVSGLLSSKTGGPPVRPPAPNMGLSTAFGRSNDWTTSAGEDRYRRAVYTEVRRNAPYPSFATFDAPNREVCTIRRNRTNTPLQAFVTLNDPVYVEASQGLARLILTSPGAPDPLSRLRFAFRRCLSRDPDLAEASTLEQLLSDALTEYTSSRDKAVQMATNPLGPAPAGVDVAELAAWTVVSNVVLNMDEFLMRR